MATIQSIVSVDQKPSKEELKRIRAEFKEASKHPIVYDEDCPKLTPAQLAEFKPVGMTWEERNKLMAEWRAKKALKLVTLRVKPDCLAWFKSMGKGYTSMMADVLNYAFKNPDIVKKACES